MLITKLKRRNLINTLTVCAIMMQTSASASICKIIDLKPLNFGPIREAKNDSVSDLNNLTIECTRAIGESDQISYQIEFSSSNGPDFYMQSHEGERIYFILYEEGRPAPLNNSTNVIKRKHVFASDELSFKEIISLRARALGSMNLPSGQYHMNITINISEVK